MLVLVYLTNLSTDDRHRKIVAITHGFSLQALLVAHYSIFAFLLVKKIIPLITKSYINLLPAFVYDACTIYIYTNDRLQ